MGHTAMPRKKSHFGEVGQYTHEHTQKRHVVLDGGSIVYEKTIRCDPSLDVIFSDHPDFVEKMRELDFVTMVHIRTASRLPPRHPIWQRITDPKHRRIMAEISGLLPLTPEMQRRRMEQLGESKVVETTFMEVAEGLRTVEDEFVNVPTQLCVVCGHFGHKYLDCAVHPREAPLIRACKQNSMRRPFPRSMLRVVGDETLVDAESSDTSD